ncbi:MAG: helix-turn-helix transcriptional regulator [Ruminococcaceae bacterium]|nr:helix-turn-helix transcriptional regulator [Oscillospiraceae bacterium]
MTFGEKLSKLRKERGYTQEQLAEHMAVSRQSVGKWESDLAYPETEKLIALGKLFDCSMDYLLKEEVTDPKGAEAPLSAAIGNAAKKLMTEKNKARAKKVLTVLVILLAAVLAIDVISFAVYVALYGLPF